MAQVRVAVGPSGHSRIHRIKPPRDADEEQRAGAWPGQPVIVPFGGAEHEWAAADIGAWIARALDAPLGLLGIAGDRGTGAVEQAAFMADSQVPWAVDALGGTVSEPAWRSKPSWYLVATEDRMIPLRPSARCQPGRVRP